MKILCGNQRCIGMTQCWQMYKGPGNYGDLSLITTMHISRCYYAEDKTMSFMELHGFSDASEAAYAEVIYLHMTDTAGLVHVALVTSKTKVVPIKQLSIPRLELCGAHLLADLLNHVKVLLHIPLDNIYAWTNSTVVLSWIVRNRVNSRHS